MLLFSEASLQGAKNQDDGKDTFRGMYVKIQVYQDRWMIVMVEDTAM
jgi:hypothetical protein